MCQRFGIKKEDQSRLAERFSIFENNPDLEDVQVGTKAVGFTLDPSKKHIEAKAVRFGLPSFEKPLYNARIETVEEKPSFALSYRLRKMVFPASYFYEMDRKGKPHFFEKKGNGLFYLAGFYEEGHFCLLTKEGEGPIHRLPVLLAPEEGKAYLLGLSIEALLSKSLGLSDFEEKALS